MMHPQTILLTMKSVPNQIFIYLLCKYDTLNFPSSDEILNLIFNLFIIKDMFCLNTTQFLDAIASLDLEHSMHNALFYP